VQVGSNLFSCVNGCLSGSYVGWLGLGYTVKTKLSSQHSCYAVSTANNKM